MKVLLLGAGASKSAGYPLAGELLRAIEAEAQGTLLVNLRQAWQRWQKFRDTVDPPLRLLIHNPNPEIMLTHLDLCEAAMHAHDDEHFRDVARAMRGETAATVDHGQYWHSRARKALQKAPVARNRLLECLREYFDAKHCEDGKPEHRARRDYLRRCLAQLEAGDAVITLNWDTTVERTLLEDKRWHPTTGYGFTQELCIGTAAPHPGGRWRVAKPQASAISVFKLHGSTGWYSNSRGEMYFRHPSYLQCFSFDEPLVDPREPPPGTGQPEGSVLLYPSYLKQVKGAEVQTIWRRAEQALEKAQEVEIWGYSLPDSDTGLRVLLNPLRFRLDAGAVDVIVHDPREEVRERWADFLGPRAHVDGQCL